MKIKTKTLTVSPKLFGKLMDFKLPHEGERLFLLPAFIPNVVNNMCLFWLPESPASEIRSVDYADNNSGLI